MLAAPIPDDDDARLAALRSASCAYAPREERFDRITRTARRLLHVPIALISVVEKDQQWFRSVQGLEIDHTARDISFCGHAILRKQPLFVPDTLSDPSFSDNPLVVGPPGIRSYLGWPLELAPGVVIGSLCVIDTMPRTYGQEDFLALKDLAAMAEAEFRVDALSSLQSRLLMKLNVLQRKGALDPLTGCWNIRGFRELVSLGVDEARRRDRDLAVCILRFGDLSQAATDAGFAGKDDMLQALVQVLRQRLPPSGALARLDSSSFCALVPARSPLALEDELAKLTFPSATVEAPDGRHTLDVPLSVQVFWLAQMGPDATAEMLWAKALAAGRMTPDSPGFKEGQT